MKQFLLVLLGLAAWVASAGAQKASSPEPYLWPTDASTHLTSTFCEFRPRHYHAAIDIKTWNKTGYRIFAIDDGYVYRIRIGATGYGKAVYLKLRDGRIVVYAHLSGFNEPLTRVTDSLRMAARKNRLDWFPRPGQFPVKRGQLLGYTGETGIGVPHLHFELRDARNRPINPLPFYRHTIADRIPPGVTRLAIIPVCAASAVQFKPDTLFLNLPVQQTLSLDQPIYLTGRAYLAAQTFDRADGVNNRLDFYRASLWANDSLIYQVQYDRFSYQTTRYVEVDKNFSLWRRGLGIFHNFFRHPANRLAFYGPTPPGGGLLDARSLRPGANRLRLEVADFFGNTTTLTLTVVYLPNRPLRL
ncbi:MAG: M23 family metallopeptidase, partial [Calditrichaeota bacterium]